LGLRHHRPCAGRAPRRWRLVARACSRLGGRAVRTRRAWRPSRRGRDALDGGARARHDAASRLRGDYFLRKDDPSDDPGTGAGGA
jgi:hypothetical protein